MRIAAFEPDRWLQPRQAACGIKGTAETETAVHQQQRKLRKPGNFDRAMAAKQKRGAANGQQFDRTEGKTSELALVELHRMQQVLTKVDLTTL